MINQFRTSTATLLLSVVSLAPQSQGSEPRPAAGFAASDSRFVVGSSEVTGSATVLVGEAITSGQLPTQLSLPDGSRYRIGIGSRVKLGQSRLTLDGGSLEVLSTGSKPPTLQVAGLEVAVRDIETRASLYMSRSDFVSISVGEGAVVISRPNGERVQTVEAGEMVTFANTRSDLKIDKRHAAADIGEVQAEQLRHIGKLGRLNPTIGGKAGMLLGALASASGGLISASMGGSGAAAAVPSGRTGFGVPTGAGLNAARSASLASYDAGAMQKAAENVQEVMSDGLWGVTGCGAGCRWGVPIVSTHIFFFPVVGGTVNPFCIVRSCLEPPPTLP